MLRDDPVLWSGCYSGAMREHRFLDGLAQAGLTVLKRDAQPWHTIAGVEFRSITAASHKPSQPRACEPSTATRPATKAGSKTWALLTFMLSNSRRNPARDSPPAADVRRTGKAVPAA